MFAFLLKVMLLSALLSIAIKYSGVLLPISAIAPFATTPVVLTAVSLPSLLMAIILSWRWRQQANRSEGKP